MANIVESKVGASQPVPVSDDEDEHSYNNGCSTTLQSDFAALQKVESPRQNFVSPVSSPDREPKIDNVSENGESDEGPIISTNSNDKSERNDVVPTVQQSSHVIHAENVSPPPDEALLQYAVVDEFGIAREINEYIKVNKINFCEMETVKELWAICDATSAAHSGLPDSLLKDAFLLVLQGHISKQKQGFLRQHLDYLIKMWKVEVQSEKSTDRPTKFVASGADYTPPVVVKKRRSNAARKRALISRMGVGEILQQARVLFATESGQYDVEEDEHGSFTIGGQELTFESWGDLTRTKDDGVYYDPTALAMTRRPKKRKTPAGSANQSNNFADVSNLSTTLSASSSFAASSTHNNTTLDGADVSLAYSSATTAPKKNGASKRKPSKQEKDEGELSESDESGGNSDSASSTSSEEDVTTMHAKKRRNKRRQTERSVGASSVTNIADVVHKAYQYRCQIAHALTFSQKAAFLECLKQQGNGAAGGARFQQISQMINTFKVGAFSSPAQ